MARKPHNTVAKKTMSTNTLRDAKLAVDIKHTQQQLMQTWKPNLKYDITTPEGLDRFSHQLIDALMLHQLDYRVAGAINGVVGNYLHRNVPTQGPPTVNVQVDVNLEALKRKADEMGKDGRRALVEAISRLEAVPGE